MLYGTKQAQRQVSAGTAVLLSGVYVSCCGAEDQELPLLTRGLGCSAAGLSSIGKCQEALARILPVAESIQLKSLSVIT